MGTREQEQPRLRFCLIEGDFNYRIYIYSDKIIIGNKGFVHHLFSSHVSLPQPFLLFCPLPVVYGSPEMCPDTNTETLMADDTVRDAGRAASTQDAEGPLRVLLDSLKDGIVDIIRTEVQYSLDKD